MSDLGDAANEQPAKKSGCGGCALWALGVVLILMVGISCSISMAKPKANPYEYKPSATAEPETVDSATVSKVKSACEAQLQAMAASSKRHLTGVPDKPYDLMGVTFTGDVERADLAYDRKAWNVPVTWTSKVADGSTLTNRQVCQFRDLQQDATLLNR